MERIAFSVGRIPISQQRAIRSFVQQAGTIALKWVADQGEVFAIVDTAAKNLTANDFIST